MISHECGDDFECHEEVNGDSRKKGDNSGRLGDDEEVDNGVENPGGGEDPEDEGGSGQCGAGEDVEQSQEEERDDVLYIILMGSPHSFHVLVHSQLSILSAAEKILKT